MRRWSCISTWALVMIAAPAFVAGQTVDDIVAKNLKAKGGLETLKGTNSVKMTGTLNAPSAPMPMTMELIAKRPNLVRREMRMGEQAMISGFDGRSAWVRQGTGPAQILSGPEAEQLKQAAEFDSVFLNYKEAGHTIELVGTEPVNGKPAHHLKITRKDGVIQHYYLDADSSLEVKMTMDAEQAGMKLKVDTELSDYRSVSGRMVPFKMRQFTNGNPAGEITFQTVEFNVPLDDSLFAVAK
jgi:outer membrane lipoprotein-sorting protein